MVVIYNLQIAEQVNKKLFNIKFNITTYNDISVLSLLNFEKKPFRFVFSINLLQRFTHCIINLNWYFSNST